MQPAIIEVFQQLPQFQHLNEDRIRAFVSHINTFEPERLLDFHIPRLGGIGGSEMGEVIGEFMDNRSRFGCRRTVVASKLLLELPEKPTPHTIRGHLNEPIIRKFFREQSGAEGLDDILAKMGNLRHSQFSWLVGRPDELVRIGNKLYLADYKCPSPGFDSEFDRDGVPFGYRVQLHHYDMLLQDAGINVDGFLLVAMDAVMPGELHIYEVDRDQKIYDAIAEIGNETWNDFVLTGILPAWPPFEPKPETLDPQKHPEITGLMQELTLLNALDSELKVRQTSVKENLSILVPKAGINKNSAHGPMNVTFKKVLDEALILERAEALSIDVNTPEFRSVVPSIEKMEALLAEKEIPASEYIELGSVNIEKVKAELVARGEPEHVFELTSQSLGLSRAKAMAEPVAELKANASKLLESYAPKVDLAALAVETLVETPQDALPEAKAAEPEVQPAAEVKVEAAVEVAPEPEPAVEEEAARRPSLKF